MIPIYEQGQGKGIGFCLSTFLDRFDAICQELVKSKKAKAFAFIFYDFENQDLRRILKNQGVFAKLDRLSGTNLSIFYLHTGKREAVSRFNTVFLSKLGIIENADPPCIVFFKIKQDQIQEIAVAQLNNTDLINGFNELYGVIERYIDTNVKSAGTGLHFLKWVKSSGKFVAIEVFRVILKNALEFIIK